MLCKGVEGKERGGEISEGVNGRIRQRGNVGSDT